VDLRLEAVEAVPQPGGVAASLVAVGPEEAVVSGTRHSRTFREDRLLDDPKRSHDADVQVVAPFRGRRLGTPTATVLPPRINQRGAGAAPKGGPCLARSSAGHTGSFVQLVFVVPDDGSSLPVSASNL
jgi:hypothetical protein